MKTLLATIVLFVLLTAVASCEEINRGSHERTMAAMQAFLEFDRLGKKFDPALAEFYDDKAVIKNTRIYPDGRERSLSLTGKQYKALIKPSMPIAQARLDFSYYRKVTFVEEKNVVKVTCDRYSTVKNYTSPYELHFRAVNGKTKIVYESSKSLARPAN